MRKRSSPKRKPGILDRVLKKRTIYSWIVLVLFVINAVLSLTALAFMTTWLVKFLLVMFNPVQTPPPPAGTYGVIFYLLFGIVMITLLFGIVMIALLITSTVISVIYLFKLYNSKRGLIMWTNIAFGFSAFLFLLYSLLFALDASFGKLSRVLETILPPVIAFIVTILIWVTFVNHLNKMKKNF